MKNLVLLFFLFFSPLFAQEKAVIDLETLAYQRKETYSSGPYEKIIIYSMPRTASSLIYNLCRYLFEEDRFLSVAHHPFSKEKKVIKTHDHKNVKSLAPKNVLSIIPTRDPVQAALSKYRVMKEKPKDIPLWCKSQIKKERKFQKKVKKLEKAGCSILFISYEEIEKGVPYLLDKLENFFMIHFLKEDRQRLIDGYCKENVAKNISELTTFNSSLSLSGFHGNHIKKEEEKIPEEVLYWLKYYNNL